MILALFKLIKSNRRKKFIELDNLMLNLNLRKPD